MKDTNIVLEPQTVPLVVVAAELGVSDAELERDLAPDIGRDATGFRVISRELAAGLLAARDERLAAANRRADEQAERDQARREQSQAQRERERARRAAIDARQAQIRASNPGISAIELMVGADSPATAAADQRMDDWLHGHPDKPIVYRKHN